MYLSSHLCLYYQWSLANYGSRFLDKQPPYKNRTLQTVPHVESILIAAAMSSTARTN